MQCVVWLRRDWQAIQTWALTLEREVIAACLALGGSEQECAAK